MVEAALASLRTTLDGTDAEVVLVCDASSLVAGPPAREWTNSDDRVRVLETPDGASLAAACNSAASTAASEILVFLSRSRPAG